MTVTIPVNIEQRPIAVIGAGTLGSRIALMMATQGAEVRISDPGEEARARGVAFASDHLAAQVGATKGGKAGKIIGAATLEDAIRDAWIVFEAVPEKVELKRSIFGDLDRLAAADAILASNSSSFPSSEFIGEVGNPARVLNTHFMMPPQISSVELMSSGATDDRIIDLLMDRFPRYGLTPYHVMRESVGFIFNRIWAAIKRESLAVAAEGVATAETVDRIFRQNFGTAEGPFRMMDEVGLDVVLNIEEHYASIREGIPEEPRQLLRRMIGEGRLGQKSGRGFYSDYS
ncbi:3-hydroxyacyl-CoA dehydrogenase family protein [Paracoccus sp. (in: a-proteobacteria)]|uniref:3-hydroxyacyl-CoA dehydrogenase family protein n=1 Tax=Paracoccus sp. TaxID=267 RepID=UPI003A845A4B